MQIIDILISGLLLSGTYALVAMGLNLQYGVARINESRKWRGFGLWLIGRILALHIKPD